MPDGATVRTHALAVATVSWLLLFWSHTQQGMFDRFGTLRGVDFLQFYTAGLLIADGRAAALYDWDTFARTLQGVVPGAGDILFLPVYPPQVALLFSPLAGLAFMQALAAWVAVSAALCLAAAALLWRSLPPLAPYRREAILLGLAFPPLLQLLGHGQMSALPLLVLVLAWCAWDAGRTFWTGFALGSLAFKPQLGVFACAALILTPSAKLVSGIAAGIALQILLVLTLLGPDLLIDYGQTLTRVLEMPAAFEPKPSQMHSLRGAILLLLGRSSLTTWMVIVGGAVTIWLAWQGARRHRSPTIGFAILCLAALTLNPHLYVYDLVLLAVPLACVAAWLVHQPTNASTVRVAWLAYALVWLPLIGPMAQVTRIQLTAPAMMLLLWQLARVAPAPSTVRQ